MVRVYGSDFDRVSLRDLMSADPNLRVLGFDRDEWWKGSAVIDVRQAQSEQQGEFPVRVEDVEGFEDGEFGWATIFSTLVAGDSETPLRTSMVLHIEAGVWRVIHFHNSIPVPNQQVFGVEITTTLDDLVASVLDADGRMPVGPATEGTVTLVFTEVVDSASLAERIGDDRWAALVAQHEGVIGAVTASPPVEPW